MNPSERRKKCNKCGRFIDDSEIICIDCKAEELEKDYDEGYEEGKKEGYQEGYEKGQEEGFIEGMETAQKQMQRAVNDLN